MPFFPSTLLGLRHIKWLFYIMCLRHMTFSLSPKLKIKQQTTWLKLSTRDYTTIMYPAWGQFILPENLLTNLDILEFISWECVWFSSLQSLSPVWLFVTQWTAAQQACLSITNSQSLLKLMSIESVMPSNHLILCRALLLLPSIFPTIKVFSNELALHSSWPKYWRFSFSISPSNEYSELISFVLEIQLQHQSFQWIFRTDFI